MSLSVELPARIRPSLTFAIGIAGFVLPTATLAQHTQRVSVSSSETQGNDYSGDQLSISPDGRFVAFSTLASFAPGDTNVRDDVYLRDRLLGTTIWVSAGIGGAPGLGNSYSPHVSADSRYVVFDSTSSNLVPGDTTMFTQDAFLWDGQIGTIEAISVPTGQSRLHQGQAPFVSADGRFVTFVSQYPFVPEDTNQDRDVYLRDRQFGTTERISLGQGGTEGDDEVVFGRPSMSADSRFVVFTSAATNMVPGDTNGSQDVFVRDLLLGTTEIMSLGEGGNPGDGHCNRSTISADGRYVAFESASTNLVPGDTNGVRDIFVRDRTLGTIERVTVDSTGQQADTASRLGFYPEFSGDGRFVAFSTAATNLVRDDTNSTSDAFLRDRVSGTTERVSLSSAGIEGNGLSEAPAVSSDGRLVCFVSGANNLVAGDTNQAWDVFVRDRDATAFVGFCEPGADGVIACPCANPPSGAGRGCDNFGAGPIDSGTLTATGAAYLGEDSVVLQASGENNTSLTVFWTGMGSLSPTGVAHGAGVRCVTQALKRMYTHSASGGTVSAPVGPDLSVSARTAQTYGTAITAGETRHYFAIYRDPQAATPCGNTSSTINLTNAGSITWSL